MKKIICVLLSLCCFVLLCACGGTNDKEKLIGTYYNNFKFTQDLSDDSYIKWDELRKITFSSDNTFIYETSGTQATVMFGITVSNEEIDFSGSGTFTMKDGFITLQYPEDSDLEHNLPGNLRDPIPYYINEYTKQLIFCVKNDGTSDWTKL